jgi:hypothetical protein
VEGYTCAAMLCYAMDTALCLTCDWERRTERDVCCWPWTVGLGTTLYVRTLD